MVYAILKNRQEDEQEVSISTNFTSVTFNGDVEACKKLEALIEYVDEILIQNFQEELEFIDDKLTLLRGIKVPFLDKLGVIYEQLKLKAGRNKVVGLLCDSAEVRELQYLNAFATIGFDRSGMYEHADGTMIQNFQLDLDLKSLDVLIERFKKKLRDTIKKDRENWHKKYRCSFLNKTVSEDEAE